MNGGIAPLGKFKDNWIFKQIGAIVKKYGLTLTSPVGDIPEEAINQILYGSDELITVTSSIAGITQNHTSTFDGLVNFIQKQHDEAQAEKHTNWTQRYMMANECPECKGTRLKKGKPLVQSRWKEHRRGSRNGHHRPPGLDEGY